MHERSTSSQARTSLFHWQGKDKAGQNISGEARAANAQALSMQLKRQGVVVTRMKKKLLQRTQRITEQDLCMFARQFATLLKAGLPLLQSFDILAHGHANPSVTRLLLDIRSDIETGTSLTQAFRRHPKYFDPLFCHLIAAGEQAGILDSLLSRLAIYREKSLALKRKIRSAMFYPAAVLSVAVIVTSVIMVWVIPSFKSVFSSFGAELPWPTLLVIWLSDQFVSYGPLMLGTSSVAAVLFRRLWKRSARLQMNTDRLLLKLPLLGPIVRKAVIARWTRTLSTLFAAGIPLVESLDAVAGTAGNAVYHQATLRIASAVRAGNSLSLAMQQSRVFPPLALQMTAIGEESGALDELLRKVAEFHEEEVDAAVASLSSLLEPVIMVVLGVLIGGLVIAMYLPIFKLGAVI